jgi:Raf kinase inhibitor-like YbhB/YbcL family protein
MQLTSPVFANQDTIPDTYGPKGKNKHPALMISDAPEGTTSFAIIMHDPDAMRGDFLHWAIWNISPACTTIAEGVTPEGAVEGMNDMKKPGYLRPMPPTGTGVHRYIFKVYALNTLLDLSTNTDRAAIEAAIDRHVIADADLTGLFSR